MPSVHITLEGDKPRTRLVMVGSHPALGWWDPGKGATLEWTGKAWETTEPVALSALSGHLDYKFVRVGEGSPQWEEGRNRVLEVPVSAHGNQSGPGCDMLLSADFSGSSVYRSLTAQEAATRPWSHTGKQGTAAKGDEALWRAKFEEATNSLASTRVRAEEEAARWSQEEKEAVEIEEALRRELAEARRELEGLNARPTAEVVYRPPAVHPAAARNSTPAPEPAAVPKPAPAPALAPAPVPAPTSAPAPARAPAPGLAPAPASGPAPAPVPARTPAPAATLAAAPAPVPAPAPAPAPVPA